MDDSDFKNRIEQIKAQNGIEDVARRLGLQGHGRRVFCPRCQPSGGRTPDLAIYDSTWTCYKCGAGKGADVIALVQHARGCSFKEACTWLGAGFGRVPERRLATPSPSNIIAPRRPPPPHIITTPQAGKPGSQSRRSAGGDIATPPEPTQNLDHLLRQYEHYKQELAGSVGEQYLASRGITLEEAQRFELGYSAPGRWIRSKRDWKGGRLVFPTHSLNGQLQNLYSRACEWTGHLCPDYLRHDIGIGPKGYFGSAALGQETLFVTEGSFDRLALALSGVSNSVCIFGLKSFKWPAFSKVRHIVLCFDNDQHGRKEIELLALEGLLRGKRISTLAQDTFRGCKDLAESYQLHGSLALHSFK